MKIGKATAMANRVGARTGVFLAYAVLSTCVALACMGCAASGQSANRSASDDRLDAVSDAQMLESGFAAGSQAQAESSAAVEVGRVPLDTAALPAETVISQQDLEALDLDGQFTVAIVPDDVFARMEGVTFPANCPVSRADLRYIRMLHVNAEGDVKIGEMVAHQAIADDVCDIFRQLYEAGYPIERIRLADDYDGDDEASMEADNSSCFNCRPIEGTGEMSWHGYGLAVDINTLYNPYYYAAQGVVLPVTAWDYVDRSIQTPYTVNRGDLCYQLFTEHGFEWGGDWDYPYDYQHFEKRMW